MPKRGALITVFSWPGYNHSMDGNYSMTCGSDKTVKLWNPHRNLLLKTYTGHGGEPMDVTGSSDNSTLLSGGADRSAILWDVATGKPTRKIRDHTGAVNTVSFNEESTVVFTGAQDGRVRAFDCRSRNREPLQVMDEATDSVTSLCVSDHEIMSGSADGRVRRYDLRQGKMHEDFVGKSVTSVNFTRDGQCTLISSLDSTVRLLDKDKGELLASFSGHKNLSYKIDNALNHSDTQVLSGSEDGLLFVWDLVEMSVVEKLKHPLKHVIHSVSTHPTKQLIITASLNHVFLWGEEESVNST